MKFAALWALCLASTAGAEVVPVDRDAVWFKPSLAVDSAPICAEVLRVELDTFFSAQEHYAEAGWQPLVDDTTWPGMEWTYELGLYAAPDGKSYALDSRSPDQRRVYRLVNSNVDLACAVTLTPKQISENKDPAIRDAWRSMEALRGAYTSVSQGDGYCGTLQAHARRYQYLEQRMQEALYRPWVTYGPWGESAPVKPYLEMWALGGVAEYRAHRRYLDQVARTVEDIAGLYQKKFAWSKAEAHRQAAAVIDDVLDHAFAVSRYSAASQAPLRRAILERQPLAVIKRLEVGGPDKDFAYDSVLNVAIEYPEALQYLLSKGLDPNATNAFGKTPLMYAAQFNQGESTRILLAAGADPNAATYLPDDTCFYNISTSDMTPLHYAVRYGSAPLIRMLVSAGAFTFNRSQKEAALEDYPIDWLKRYADAEKPEKNPNLAATELPALFDLLRVPSDEDRQRISADLVKREQAEYARGDFKSAYRLLTLALSAQPSNEKALADRPLVALKAGQYAEALVAARRQIKVSTSPSDQAAAWFNVGLICERDRDVGVARCDDDWLWPFVQAWHLQPTRARSAKLLGLFDLKGAGSCESQDWKVWPVMTGNNEVERIYVLHTAGDSLHIEPDAKRVIDNLAIHDRAVTVLERSVDFALPVLNGHACHLPRR